MIFKFFKVGDIKSIEGLRKAYKELVFKHHPDKGGKTEDMQQINAEYDALRRKVGNIHETADGRTYEKAQTEAEQGADIPDQFREIINAIINFDCTIELCGKWLWVYNAYQYRTQLKDLGFFWCSRKLAWAWTEDESNNKHHLTMDEIRKIHGSEIIKKEQKKRIACS